MYISPLQGVAAIPSMLRSTEKLKLRGQSSENTVWSRITSRGSLTSCSSGEIPWPNIRWEYLSPRFSTKPKQNHITPTPKLISIQRHLKSYLWFDRVVKNKTKQKLGNDLHCLFIKSELGTNFVFPAFRFPSAALAWLRD